MAIDLANYVPVAERLAQLRAKHPEGSLQPLDPAKPFEVLTIDGQTFITVVAAAYRTPGDQRPGVGMAWEPFPGTTPYTRNSELRNAETSAWGRAIVAALAADTRGGIASSEDVRNRQAADDIDLATGSVRTTATRPGAPQPPAVAQTELPVTATRPTPATRTRRARAALARPPALSPTPANPADPFRPFEEPGKVLAGETWVRTFATTVREAGHSDDVRHAIVDQATGGRTRSSRQVRRHETPKVRATFEALTAGQLAPQDVAGVTVLVPVRAGAA